PLFSLDNTTATPFGANRRTTSAVRSVDPSSTTMISLRGQVWAIADWSVSAIHSSALYAGMRIETSGFMARPGRPFCLNLAPSVGISDHECLISKARAHRVPDL